MLKKSIIALSVIFVFAAASFAQQAAYTPDRNSADWKAVLDALRVPVEKELKQKIKFAVQNFKMQGSWAFVNGAPQNSAGGEPDYRNTKYAEQVNDGAFDNNFQALLKKTGGKWKVVTFAIGCTDVCWLGWDSQFKAPKAIFEIEE